MRESRRVRAPLLAEPLVRMLKEPRPTDRFPVACGAPMRRTRPLLIALVATSCLTAACAAGPAASGGAPSDPAVITREQIQTLQVTTAYDAVKALRAGWLNEHGAQSVRYPSVIQVYLDDTHMGDVTTLPNIAAPSIQYIRHYSGQEATAKWGVDHGAGAIYVSTRVGREGVPVPPASEAIRP